MLKDLFCVSQLELERKLRVDSEKIYLRKLGNSADFKCRSGSTGLGRYFK